MCSSKCTRRSLSGDIKNQVSTLAFPVVSIDLHPGSFIWICWNLKYRRCPQYEKKPFKAEKILSLSCAIPFCIRYSFITNLEWRISMLHWTRIMEMLSTSKSVIGFIYILLGAMLTWWTIFHQFCCSFWISIGFGLSIRQY